MSPHHLTYKAMIQYNRTLCQALRYDERWRVVPRPTTDPTSHHRSLKLPAMDHGAHVHNNSIDLDILLHHSSTSHCNSAFESLLDTIEDRQHSACGTMKTTIRTDRSIAETLRSRMYLVWQPEISLSMLKRCSFRILTTNRLRPGTGDAAFRAGR